MSRLISWVVAVSCRRPWLTVAVSVALGAAGAGYAASTLAFESSMLQLLPKGAPYVVRYQQYSREFGELDAIAIVVGGRTPAESKAYAARLSGRLRGGPVRFHRLAYRIDPKDFERSALLHMSVPELRDLSDQILSRLPLVESYAAHPTLDRLLEGIDREIVKQFVGRFFDLGLGGEADDADIGIVRALLAEMRARVETPGPTRSPWSALVSVGDVDEDAGYFFSRDKRLLFILADPVSTGRGAISDRDAVAEIRGAIARLRAEFPAVEVGVTGGPALAGDEMTAALGDGEVATALAVAFTLAILLAAFRRPGQPLLMLGALGLSLAWSLGLIALLVGHLTVFSVMFISIVVGLGIDYGIYFLFRYREEMARGRPLPEALALTAAGSGPGIFLGALTGAATFYVLVLARFRGIQEFGFVAGTALLMALAATLTVFPALLTLWDRRDARRAGGAGPALRPALDAPILEAAVRRPAPILLAALAVTALAFWGVRQAEFDYNLLDLQARGTESVAWERRILETEGRSSFSALATARSLDELRRKHEAFEKLGAVSEVESALLLLPDRQAEKLEIIGEFGPQVAAIEVAPPRPVDLERLTAALGALGKRFDMAEAEAGPGGPGAEISAAREEIARLLRLLRETDRARLESALGRVQTALRADFARVLGELRERAGTGRVTLADLPKELRGQYVGKRGHLLIKIQPRVNIWERDGATRFVEELRTVDREVTGTPVITYEALQLLERAYRTGTLYAVALLALLAAASFRRAPETILALVPPLLGTVWAIGLMRVFDIKFNMANVWALPLIIGASAEYGVNVLGRSVEARESGGPLLARSTVVAVLYNGLTMITGFGCLLVAHHRGMWSLGLLLTIGSATSLVAALVVLPVLVRLFLQPAGQPGNVPERAP